jgi:hypothetical protein
MLVAQVGEIGSVGVDLVDVFGERILCGGRCDNGCISESVEVLPVHPEKLPSTIDAFARGLFFRTKRQLEVGGSVRGRRHDIVVIYSLDISTSGRSKEPTCSQMYDRCVGARNEVKTEARRLRDRSVSISE